MRLCRASTADVSAGGTGRAQASCVARAATRTLRAAACRARQGLLAVIGLVGLLWPGFAADSSHCFVCGSLFGTTLYRVTDEWSRETVLVCDRCALVTDRCAVCELPVMPGAVAVGDGRRLCARDASLVILDDAEALKVLEQTRSEIDRMFARFTVFPTTNVQFNFEDTVHMQQLLNAPGFERQCPSLLGYVKSTPLRDGAWQHELRLLRALPRSQMISVYSHELGHLWSRENLPPTRRIARYTEEGFCELVSHRVLEHLGETNEVARVLRNNYTRGQVDLFVKASQALEFNAVLEWMKFGEDLVLRGDEPDRIRVLNLPAPPPARELPPVDVDRVRPLAAPDRLILRGVLGSATRRTALVNDTALMAGETGRVRVGTNTLAVRCLTVSSNAASLVLEETGEKVVLQLATGPESK